MTNITPGGTPPSPKEVNTNSTNRVDAFTQFINEWMDTSVKVFTRRENNHDGEVL